MPQFIPWNSQPLDAWANQHPQGKFIDLSDHLTHYLEQGEGEPVILIHGFYYDSYMWASNIEALATRFKVYAPDLWGFGYSTREPLEYGYPLYAGQVLQFMDSLGIEQASLVGQSMGAGTSIKFCVQHRERVNKLLMVDAACLPNSLPLTGKFFILPGVGEFLIGLNTNAILKKNLVDFWIHNKDLVTDAYFENVTRFMKIKGTTEALMSILRRQFFDTLTDELHLLAEMDVPILLVWGREDKAVPARLGQEMHRILKGSRLEILDNAGHVPNYEKAERFNQLALEFL
jgi:pimeloyl-ACP methyl ester carboxylesterase